MTGSGSGHAREIVEDFRTTLPYREVLRIGTVGFAAVEGLGASAAVRQLPASGVLPEEASFEPQETLSHAGMVARFF
jgi:hypothetical protein